MDIRAFLYENSDVLKGMSKQSKRGWNGSSGKKRDNMKRSDVSRYLGAVKAIHRSVATTIIPIVEISENTRQDICRRAIYGIVVVSQTID